METKSKHKTRDMCKFPRRHWKFLRVCNNSYMFNTTALKIFHTKGGAGQEKEKERN
jgi:hypothetical protein